jgi:hypothetical protein
MNVCEIHPKFTFLVITFLSQAILGKVNEK